MNTLTKIFHTVLLSAALVWPQYVFSQTNTQALSPIKADTTLRAETASPTPSVAAAPAQPPIDARIQVPTLPGSNLVYMIRHALAPGAGDPAGFRLGDCATQRNLSGDGIRQAKEIGNRLKSLGVIPSSIWSSEWCRAIDTATNLGLGPVKTLPALNSFFARPGLGPSQMQQLKEFLAKLDPSKGPYIMVTHQVVITDLTGVFPGSGEGVWLKLTADPSRPWIIHSMTGP